MDVSGVVEWLTSPFTMFFDTRQRLSIFYQLTALIVAIGVYCGVAFQDKRPFAVGLLRWLLPRDVLLHPSATTDYLYLIINKLVLGAIFASGVFAMPVVFDLTLLGLTQIFGPAGSGLPASLAVSLLCTLFYALVMDFTLWAAHLAFHKVPILWEFHKVHHSAEVMTPITAARMHPLETMADSMVASFTLGFTAGAMKYLIGDGAIIFTLFNLNLFMAIFFLAAFNLRHSHVWVRYPWILQHIFICPAQHQIHHSRARRHWDKNMGFIFAFWDWAAGTLYAPKEKEEIEFGLGNEEDGTWRGVTTLYFRPFRNAWRILTNKPSTAAVRSAAGSTCDDVERAHAAASTLYRKRDIALASQMKRAQPAKTKS